MKLVVETDNAPQEIVESVISTLLAIGTILNAEAKLNHGHNCRWAVKFHQPGGYVKDNWWAGVIVAVVRKCRLPTNCIYCDERSYVEIPITEVSEINVFTDGTWEWHSNPGKPAEDETMQRLRLAVTTGKVPVPDSPGHSYIYRVNQ